MPQHPPAPLDAESEGAARSDGNDGVFGEAGSVEGGGVLTDAGSQACANFALAYCSQVEICDAFAFHSMFYGTLDVCEKGVAARCAMELTSPGTVFDGRQRPELLPRRRSAGLRRVPRRPACPPDATPRARALPPSDRDRLLERHPDLGNPLNLLDRKVELRARATQ
jgi:hypothetical protein